MKLGDWLKMTKTRQYKFAAKVGVSAGMVSDYVAGRARPSRPEIYDAIACETGNLVLPNDFYDLPRAPDAPQTGAPAQ